MGNRGGLIGGISLGGILVIIGLLLALIWGKVLLGVIIAVVGLVAFGGFVKGKWY